MTKKPIISPPSALFDAWPHIQTNQPPAQLSVTQIQDYQQALSFLQCYAGSMGTFNAYRREIEKLLQWSWIFAQKSIKDLGREDAIQFIQFCQKPPQNWIGTRKVPRFLNHNGQRAPNPAWRPFAATLPKAAYRQGRQASVKDFNCSNDTLKECFAIVSSFYNYLVQESYTCTNPMLLIRQKSRWMRTLQTSRPVRRLTPLQWQYVIQTAQRMTDDNPHKHERTLFIMTALYAMYLRISELAVHARWAPSMNHFYRDQQGLWWFVTVGKGNKERHIAVSDAMLKALRRYRQSLGLTTPLPTHNDHSPLLPKRLGRGGISSVTYLRELVQDCFNRAVDHLHQDQHEEEALSLQEATAHWLRHTGISDDVKHRPREHVRDDAGHSSGIITDRYIDINRTERHASASKKPIILEE